MDEEPTQQGLDDNWEMFCMEAKRELHQMFEVPPQDWDKYTQGDMPVRVKVKLFPNMVQVEGQSGPARGWSWLARELAWITALTGKVLQRGFPGAQGRQWGQHGASCRPASPGTW